MVNGLSYEYILYIDEAGDDGTKKVLPVDTNGASEWLCISGLLLRRRYERDVVNWVRNIRADIDALQGPALHFRNLSPSKKLRTCNIVAGLPVRAFVLCSNKKNMRGHNNERAAKRGGKQWFYNFCVRILMERVTDLCWRNSMKHSQKAEFIRVIFSKRGGHSYGQTKAYWEILKAQAAGQSTYLQKREIRHETLAFPLVDYVPHYQNAGLQLADVIASAFYTAVDTRLPAWSVDYAKRFDPIMARENGVIADFGVVLQPTPPSRALLTSDQKRIFAHYGYTF